MDSTTEINNWLDKLKQQDNQAVELIWNNYFSRLVSLARHKLGNLKLRSADEEDIALSAMNSFVDGVTKGRFPELSDPEALWNLLLVITCRKVKDYRKKHFAKKRGGGNVRGESVFIRADHEKQTGIAEVLGDAPTPEVAAAMAETFQQLLNSLEDETLRQVALGKLEGYTVAELAQQLNMSPRSICRKLELIRNCWSQEDPEIE